MSRGQWLHLPERSSLRNAIFQIHLWIGAAVSLYVFLMSVSGSIIVFRNALATSFPSIERARQTSREPRIGTNRQDRERSGRNCCDIALSDRSHHLVAGNQALAS